MANTLSKLALATACLLPLCAMAQDDDAAEPTEQRFYFAIGGNWITADRDRGTQDGSGFTAAIGKRFGSYLAAELKYDEVNLDSGAAVGDTKGNSFALDVYLYARNYPDWNPYVVVSAGQNRVKRLTDPRDNVTVLEKVDFTTLEAGVGFQNEVTERGSAIRTDVRYRHEQGSGDAKGLSFNDFAFNLNLLIPLGARQADADSRPAPPDPADPRVYFVVGTNYLRPDRDRLSDDAFGYRVGLGWQYRPTTAIEFRAEGNNLDAMNGTDSYDLSNYGIDILFHRVANNTLRPFFLLGLGRQSTDTNIAGVENNYDAFSLDAGFGIQTVPWSYLGMRFDVRNRTIFVENKDRDLAAGESRINDVHMNLAAIVPIGRDPWKEEEVEEEAVVAVAEVVQVDTDGDGVLDTQDQCPNTPAGAEVDTNGCERDNDNDGVPNSRDKCPNSAPGAQVDETGCVPIPDVLVLEGVNFATDSARLTENAERILDGVAERLRARPDVQVEVAGHTDSVGAAAYNQALSSRRARSVMDYLVSKGVNAANLTSRGYGESSPVADNNTADGRAKNRRVELRVIK